MSTLRTFLDGTAAAVLVTVSEARGSTPREAGAIMIVSAEAIWGTIGGGQLEFMAIDNARDMLSGGGGTGELDVPLGPEIGQCCGGRTRLTFQTMTPELTAGIEARLAAETERFPQVVLFGAGHVGRALAEALLPLPFRVTVVESRQAALDDVPEGLEKMLAAMPEALVDGLAPGSAVIVLTHDHALDFLIARQALARGDLAYVGMIGSATKRATFKNWLARETDGTVSSDALVLPVGGSMVHDKRPAVIAALVAAELLTRLLSKTTG
ncbi:xanthine dehydrogenase accessory protein XdhC [Rhizobium sp. 0TCS1.26]|uniref:xanthine dehydrogenase accessory protein XdhC n=1 Tax=Rhizobium sp. 0TCS1.26 TaxID=3142623 RepID=UPI003D2CB5B6